MLFSLLGPQIVMLLNDVRAITYKEPKMQQHSKIVIVVKYLLLYYMYTYKSLLEIILGLDKANY